VGDGKAKKESEPVGDRGNKVSSVVATKRKENFWAKKIKEGEKTLSQWSHGVREGTNRKGGQGVVRYNRAKRTDWRMSANKKKKGRQ